MGVLDSKVAFITGAARGQGREAAILFAEHGAKVLAADICESIKTVGYQPGGSAEAIAADRAGATPRVSASAMSRSGSRVKSTVRSMTM